MARPVVSAAAEELFAACPAWARADGESTGWAFLHFCEAICRKFQTLEDVIRDTDLGPGWSHVLDVDRAPAAWLPWLSQFVGVRLIPGETEAQNRDRIKRRDGLKRGTVNAMRAAVEDTLTGTKHVILNERNGSAYRLSVRTLGTETPDPTKTLAAALSQKPAGIVLDYGTYTGPTYDVVRANFDTYQQVKDYYVDYQDMRSEVL